VAPAKGEEQQGYYCSRLPGLLSIPFPGLMELAIIVVGAEALGMVLVSAVEVAPDEVG
jgi:hypothetical protein